MGIREAGCSHWGKRFRRGTLCNHLARLGHSCERDGYLSLDELAADFSLERLGRAPARHDPQQTLRSQTTAADCACSSVASAACAMRTGPRRPICLLCTPTRGAFTRTQRRARTSACYARLAMRAASLVALRMRSHIMTMRCA